ncbi:MAG TPA: hypothetical protein VLI90_03770 [Tepidisphaeraceae bacterium]|nr:hypothetical protein [Tepidisphaeraceae bacterium]
MQVIDPGIQDRSQRFWRHISIQLARALATQQDRRLPRGFDERERVLTS